MALSKQKRAGEGSLMFALTLIMTCLLGYQVFMPQVNNAKYAFTVRDGVVIRMNTQDGTM